jgi:hypothetical protein
MSTNNAIKQAGGSAFIPVSSSLCSSPILSNSLSLSYGVLGDDMKRLFNRVYHYLWHYVNDRSIKNMGFMAHYWLIPRLVSSSCLAPSEFIILSYLYMMTQRGKYLIHSNRICFSGVLPGATSQTVGRVLWDIKHAGMITRHHKDPARPHEHKAQHNKQAVFIKITPKGLQFIEQMEKDLNKILINTSLNDLTGSQ